MITEEDIATYERDGVVCLRGMIDPAWLDGIAGATDRILAKPGPLAKRYGTESDQGEFRGETYVADVDAGFDDFARNGPGAEIAATIMRSAKINFFFDHLLVKEPGSEARTPWHHDLPYWCVDGDQVCSVWLSLDPVTGDSGAVRFVRGSHRWPELYRAQDFNMGGLYGDGALPAIPDIDADPARYDLLWFDTEPGDCLVFHARTVHGAPGNAHASRRRRALSVRYTGDDVVFIERPEMVPPLRETGLRPGQPLDCELFPVVWQAA